jgi:V8-like Glu-specific endopeptidase
VGDILDYNIMYFCPTETTSSGSPILRISNKKVIGVHKQGMYTLNCSKGTFLKIQ